MNNAIESDQPLDAENWIGLIEVLLESYPDAVSDQDKRGRTPFSSGLQLMDSLSHSRREEDDAVLLCWRCSMAGIRKPHWKSIAPERQLYTPLHSFSVMSAVC